MSQPPSPPPTSPSVLMDFSNLQYLVQRLTTPHAHPASSIAFPNDIARNTASLAQADEELVNSGLSDVENVLGTLSSAQVQIDALATFMATQRAHLEATRASYLALVAPIRALPAEVLQEIFMFVRELEGQECRTPSVVSQVNQYWRRVALATPQLWTTIVLPVKPGNTLQRVEELETRMQRTGGRPTSLTVVMKRKSGTQEGRQSNLSAVAALAQAVLPYSHRLGSLSLHIFDGEVLQHFLNLWVTPALDLTNLRELNLECLPISAPPENAVSAVQSICSKARNLHKLFIVQFDEEEEFKTPSDSLKAFRFPLNPPTATALFRSAPLHLQLLEIVQLSYHPIEQLPIPSSPYSPLANLTTLVLGALLPPSIITFPPLPSLRHLIMDKCLIRDDEDDDNVVAMAREWGATLRYLALPSNVSPNAVKQALRLLPNLEAISVPDACYLLELVSEPDFEPASMPARLSHVETDLDEWAAQWDGDFSLIESLFQKAISGSIPSLTTLTLFLSRDEGDNYYELTQTFVQGERPRFSEAGIDLWLDETGLYFSTIFKSQYLKTAGVSHWYIDA